jgi:hypothetical protein
MDWREGGHALTQAATRREETLKTLLQKHWRQAAGVGLILSLAVVVLQTYADERPAREMVERLGGRLTVDGLGRIIGVGLIGGDARNEDMAVLSGLHYLRVPDVSETRVDDRGVAVLAAGLAPLQSLIVATGKVSAGAAERFAPGVVCYGTPRNAPGGPPR